MIPTSVTNPGNTQNPTSAVIGIASVILEGRALFEEEYVGKSTSSIADKNSNPTLYFCVHNKESDTKEPLENRNDDTIQHFERLRQKLSQLRQSSPGTSREQFAEQEVSLGSKFSTSSRQSNTSDEDDEYLDFHTKGKGHSSHHIEGHFLNSLQSLATTCLRTTPRSFNLSHNPADVWPVLKLKASTHNSYLEPSNTKATRPSNLDGRTETENYSALKQGPHCDQFLRKLGVVVKTAEPTESEEHLCDISNPNEICYRWQIHCVKIVNILSRNDPICIEIYLGPENKELLLEQWVIYRAEKPLSATMSLQSLINAIRSQLYFSQITAWTDQIITAYPYDKEFLDHPRIKKCSKNLNQKPQLDIAYRIKAYDSTACFTSKPNSHNFPDIVVSENCTLRVCLKSLPRISGGIPKVNDPDSNIVAPTNSNSYAVAYPSSEEEPKGSDENMLLDDRLNVPCHEKGKHRCSFSEEENPLQKLTEHKMLSNMSHREKQLMKYRKRMLKRDKKAKRSSDSDSSGSQSSQCMQTEQRKRFTNESLLPNIQGFGSINSFQPPLYQTAVGVTESVQTSSVEMISVATQTNEQPINIVNCLYCGNEMHFLCFNCDQAVQDRSHDRLSESQGDILLKAIQRTPKGKFNQERVIATPGDCQLCKRQKTQHNNNNKEVYAEQNQSSDLEEKNKCRIDNKRCPEMRLDCNCSEKSPAQISEPNHSNITAFDQIPQSTGSQPSTPEVYCLEASERIIDEFKTPKHNVARKNELKPVFLELYHGTAKKMPSSHKAVPKINLSNIFSSPSSPIPIATCSSTAFSFEKITSETAVQKSNSAPSLPNSPSLSPRFLKQAAVHKRRTRHLSDRSFDRTSIGSDDQFSDEDLEGAYSPTLSPVKNKFFQASIFRQRPLLGNLEESLFHKRLIPKYVVSGFKVLLGASGGFYPNQLTIPATSFFYELKGESLSTPYVCEIRLSRKGYTIPPTGTVQATLLNPLGTVVRMFVIPYDFNDMPNMSQTFIRQRILAVDGNMEDFRTSLGSQLASMQAMNFTSQMKNLRYAIHLRFQTSRTGRLALHTDIRLLISRRTDCDTAAAHAKGTLESPNELRITTLVPENPKYSRRQESLSKI